MLFLDQSRNWILPDFFCLYFIKFGYSEKARKFEKNLPLKILWPFQNIWISTTCANWYLIHKKMFLSGFRVINLFSFFKIYLLASIFFKEKRVANYQIICHFFHVLRKFTCNGTCFGIRPKPLEIPFIESDPKSRKLTLWTAVTSCMLVKTAVICALCFP